jgi:hypothetical protein
MWNNASSFSVVGATGTNVTSHAIAATGSQTLYQTEMDGSMNFTFSNLSSSGSYLVSLLFSDNVCSSVACRVFSVFVNKTLCAPTLDVFGQTGAQFAAYIVNCPLVLTGTTSVAVDLVSVSGLQPFVDAIMIVPSSWTNPYTQDPGSGN